MAEDKKAKADASVKPSEKSASEKMLGGEKKTESKGEKKSEKSKHVKHKHTHIEHHADGSHTVRHTPVSGGDEVSYAAPDMDAVHDGLEQHVGEPNADEGQEGGAPAPSPAADATPQGV